MGTDPLRAFARGALGGDVGLEGEPGVRSTSLLARPVWVNVNWFFIRGLEQAGLLAEANELRRMTLELVGRSGFFEYYDPRAASRSGSVTSPGARR